MYRRLPDDSYEQVGGVNVRAVYVDLLGIRDMNLRIAKPALK